MVLVDTNAIVRFFTGEPQEQFEESRAFFENIKNGNKSCMVEQMIIGEVLFVMSKVYGAKKAFTVERLKKLCCLEGIFCDDKEVMLAALDMYAKKSIDFADAILCAKANLRGFEVFSFDKDVKKCTKKTSQK